MATFISTTLTRRTGATTTVFTPSTIQPDGTGVLFSSGLASGLGARLELTSVRSGNGRKARAYVQIPQLTAAAPYSVVSRPAGYVDLWIPDGAAQTDVNDLVGYLNALTAPGLTNLNDILVNGAGVY